jgi:bacteriocin-like protein
MPTNTTIARELTAARLDNELRDEELEQVIGGRKIDESSPLFFQNAGSGTPFKSA